MNPKSIIKGRGAQHNVPNRFFELSHEQRDDFLEFCSKSGEQADKYKTQYLPVFPKTIVKSNKSRRWYGIFYEHVSRLRAWLCVLLCQK